jgi:hypothetical protein
MFPADVGRVGIRVARPWGADIIAPIEVIPGVVSLPANGCTGKLVRLIGHNRAIAGFTPEERLSEVARLLAGNGCNGSPAARAQAFLAHRRKSGGPRLRR